MRILINKQNNEKKNIENLIRELYHFHFQCRKTSEIEMRIFLVVICYNIYLKMFGGMLSLMWQNIFLNVCGLLASPTPTFSYHMRMKLSAVGGGKLRAECWGGGED